VTGEGEAGGLDIRSGGLIAVDTGTLRDAAGTLAELASECAGLADQLRAAGVASMHAGLLDPSPAGRAEQAHEKADRLAHALRERAEAYELIELEAARGFASGEGRFRAGAMSRLLARPASTEEAARLLRRWLDERHREVERQLTGAVAIDGPVSGTLDAWRWAAHGLLLLLLRSVRMVDRGAIPSAAPPLAGRAQPTRVAELERTEVAAPSTLEEIAARMPGEGDGRVRVEVYEPVRGDRQYVVYIAGTQSLGWGGDDPWDMSSNVALYLGDRSSSYDAVERALAAAGATHGDTVHLVGHSQGGMLASRLAREGPYDVATLITFASPVQAQLDGDALNVTVRHTDDPVAALSAGGLPVAAGSRESFVVERTADPVPQLADFSFDVHEMDEYRRTATLIDASDDPRVDALRVQLAGLGAVAGTAVVYGARREAGAPAARRISASSAGGAG